MHVAVVFDAEGGGVVRPLPAAGPAPDPAVTSDIYDTIADIEAHQSPRWILAATAISYPRLLHRGIALRRCHDIGLIDQLLRGYHGHHDDSHDLPAAHARLHGQPVPLTDTHLGHQQDTLFDTAPPSDPHAELTALVEVWADQHRQLAQLPRMRMLAAAESAGGLIACEMTHAGLPWRTDIHDSVLRDLLGPRPVAGMRPKKLQHLADTISEAFGHRFNPDSPAQLLAAFRMAGHQLESTHAWALADIDHPAIPAVQQYKKLSRIYAAHGWNWMSSWVSAGPQGPDSTAQRFRPRYVVGGVPTGRWATDGGAALQIPKVLRSAVTADDGHQLVIADAAQLEPRMLAAISRDPGMIAATEAQDMYAALAPTFGGNREDAKLALLSAMYGGTAGNAAALLAVMRQRFPIAYEYVAAAARAGERGQLVRTWLGRTCPPPNEQWWNALSGDRGVRAARDRGRFTRNFVVQGTAAEWALVMMALLRNSLHDHNAGELVFFQHDEIIVHCSQRDSDDAARFIQDASSEATRLLFGDYAVPVPLTATAAASYATVK